MASLVRAISKSSFFQARYASMGVSLRSTQNFSTGTSDFKASCCPCSISREKVEGLVLSGDRQGLRKYFKACCQKTQALERKWEAYSISEEESLQDCVALNCLEEPLS
jgi:hypothetical protein